MRNIVLVIACFFLFLIITAFDYLDWTDIYYDSYLAPYYQYRHTDDINFQDGLHGIYWSLDDKGLEDIHITIQNLENNGENAYEPPVYDEWFYDNESSDSWDSDGGGDFRVTIFVRYTGSAGSDCGQWSIDPWFKQ